MHCDLKLQNLVFEQAIQPGQKTPPKVCMIDFGSSTTFLDSNYDHLPKLMEYRYTGNLLFQSMSVAMGYTNCRNDDLEGIIYIFLYLLNDFQLPWTIYQNALTNREINLN
jgi:serine/threonine protein kinase